MVSLSKLVTLVFIIFSYRIVEFENGNHTQTSDSYSAYWYPSKSTHSISILEDNKHICIYHWIYHTKMPFLNRRHVIPPTKTNFHLLIQILLSNQVETNPGPLDSQVAMWLMWENMIFDIPIPDQESNRFTKYPKNLFSYIKTQKTESQTTPPLRSNGILKADARSKAEILNNQFQKSFTPDNADPIPYKGQSPHRLMQNINITETGIKKLLNNLKPHKAAGPDKIPSRILKECSEVISPILLIIFRKSLSCGKIPSEWKHANICPVYKKGDKHDPINYRPISLTCICCKLLEHIISSNVMSHLENNNILYDFQHGFRPSRSCETQLISFLQHVSQSNNQNIQTDTCSHRGFCKSLW